MPRYRAIAAAIALSFGMAAFAGPAPADAQPERAHIEAREVEGRILHLLIYSPSMRKSFPVDVLRPADASRPRPVLYLLNGLDAGESDASWTAQTDALEWLADKNVNVVQPIGGRGSYYADWAKRDPKLGVLKWKTFLTEELPPLIDTAVRSNGRNAIAGISTSGTSVLQLAEAKPSLYKAVAAYSGCAQIADPMGHQFVDLSVLKTGGDIANMYGPEGDPRWAANDPVVNAEKLRGLALYVYSGNGIPGPHDAMDGPHTLPGPSGWLNQVVVGGAIEAATNACTRNLQSSLARLNIPATFDLRSNGTHSWGYWEQALKNSWPTLARALAA